MTAAFVERLKTIAENVLTLEVNTIACEDISGLKMPTPEHALIDVATWYRERLRDRHGIATMWQAHEASTASREVFVRIREEAGRILQTRTSDDPVLFRMKKNSEQLKAIFERLDDGSAPPLVLTRKRGSKEDEVPRPIALLPEEVVLVRKAWELGTDEVLLQTTIQIDGDVVLRISQEVAKSSFPSPAVKLHEKAVMTSIASWERMVALIGGTLKSLAEFFLHAK